nr:PREDICTED: uncharacterized protein LOC103313805 [Tribolium castaneum]|eukprot:XP_008196224.1 PREDICTED: uncharacterized protein LOC103313805 [Tribolium castaneum]
MSSRMEGHDDHDDNNTRCSFTEDSWDSIKDPEYFPPTETEPQFRDIFSYPSPLLESKSDDNEQGLDEGGNKSPTINIQSVVTFRDGIRVDKTEGKRNDIKEEESVLPNDENQELFLADSELTIYSANEYSNSKVQL